MRSRRLRNDSIARLRLIAAQPLQDLCLVLGQSGTQLGRQLSARISDQQATVPGDQLDPDVFAGMQNLNETHSSINS
jgi:hypothetical protein